MQQLVRHSGVLCVSENGFSPEVIKIVIDRRGLEGGSIAEIERIVALGGQ